MESHGRLRQITGTEALQKNPDLSTLVSEIQRQGDSVLLNVYQTQKESVIIGI